MKPEDLNMKVISSGAWAKGDHPAVEKLAEYIITGLAMWEARHGLSVGEIVFRRDGSGRLCGINISPR